MSKLLFLAFMLVLTSTIHCFTNDYIVDELHNFSQNDTQGIFASLHYQGSDEYYKKPSSPIIQNLNTTVLFDSDNELTITIDSSTQPRFSLPHEYPYPFTKKNPFKNPNYIVLIEKEPFSIAVQRVTTGETIFNTSQFDFIYSDYYLSFGTALPSQYLYGLGERRRSFLYDSGLYTIWNKDQFSMIDYGKGNQQTYGCHPMYMVRENQTGFWDIVYLRNSNAMDFKFSAESKTLEFFLTGGMIELKFFFGTALPDNVIKLYHNYINGWTLMPFWSHGYHQSKYGMIYLEEMLQVVGNFSLYKIPIDVIWSDIDYMYSFTDFTVDNDRYNIQKLQEMAQKIHWVPIVDAGVALNETADSYLLGQKYNVWIKSAQNNTNSLIGVVWPGLVHWVDWLNENSTKYWNELLTKFHQQTSFSGIWLDMNENANFCNGEFDNNCTFHFDYLPDAIYPNGSRIIPDGDQNPDLPPSPWAWFNSTALPYVPGGVPLEEKGLSLNALHQNGTLEFDYHNLNGFMESMATYKALQNLTGPRPFILSRSTHVGSGQFAAHWSGDNAADWDYLKLSIPCIFNFQIFGIPMSGDDICGFAGNTTVELCARWMQVGSFYPFMRNHMRIGTIDQFPYSLGETVLQASMASLKLRYSILKFYYTVFVRNQGVGTVFRPVFFDYPNDTALLSLDTQFLIGSELMVAAVVEPGKDHVDVYFPIGYDWYNFATGEKVYNASETSPKTLSFAAPLNGSLPVFIRGGSLVAVQNVENVTSTKDLDNVINLVVGMRSYLAKSDLGSGYILGIGNYSDEASVDKCIGKNDCLIAVSVQTFIQGPTNAIILVTFIGSDIAVLEKDMMIGNITLYGMRTNEDDDGRVVVCSGGKPFSIPRVGAVATFYWNGSVCKSNGSNGDENEWIEEMITY